jgi:hypothetical protein
MLVPHAIDSLAFAVAFEIHRCQCLNAHKNEDLLVGLPSSLAICQNGGESWREKLPVNP